MDETTTRPVQLNWPLIDRQLAALGAVTDQQRARELDINKSTMSRWRRGQMEISLTSAIRIARRLHLDLPSLLADPPSPPPPAPRPPAGPAAPRPPAGPKGQP